MAGESLSEQINPSVGIRHPTILDAGQGVIKLLRYFTRGFAVSQDHGFILIGKLANRRNNNGGASINKTTVIPASSQNIAARVPTIIRRAKTMAISPLENASPRASTSEVARVRSRPAG